MTDAERIAVQAVLIENLERLLACYRLGKAPSGKLLDAIGKGKASLEGK